MPTDDFLTYELLLHATDRGLDQLAPTALEADEGLSRPYHVSVLTRTLDPTDPASVDPGTWLRKKVAAGLSRGDEPTWFHGIVNAVEHVGEDHAQHQIYRLELAPALILLKHTRRTRVFVDQKPIDVVRTVLQENGVSPIDVKAAGAAGQMRHITQFEESDFAFVSRLLEQEGACYWFTHTKTGHTLVIGDTATHHPGSSAVITADFAATADGASTSPGVVTELARRFEIVSKETAVRDYSESHPKSAALGQKTVVAANAPGANGKHGEADYHVTLSDGDATAYATRLADGLMNRSCRVVGASSVFAFRAGARIAVEGKDGYDDHALVTDIRHSFRDDVYTNSFSAMPVNRLPWRPLRSTPIPRIDGVVPGIVTATAGDQGGGEDGSYRVKLLGGEDENDRIVRMSQPYAGPAQGVHFPLPIDTEVLLSHEYGHPDRPIIAGAMHNVEDPSPVLDANKTQCVMKSAAGAVLIFEDKDGEEKVTLQSKALHKLEFDDKGGSEKVTLITKGEQKLEFIDNSGSEKVTLHCTKDHEVIVDGKSDTKVTGKKTIDCQDEIEISATSKITLKVGGNSIVISSSKIEITSTGDVTIDGTGKVAITAKADASLSGLNANVTGQVGAKVSGSAQAEISASGQTTVKGAIVMIN
jgi:type VI secretion system secreted protein VgrG